MLPGSESTGQDGRRAQPGERAGCCFLSEYKCLGVWSPHLDYLRLLSQYPIQISPDFTQFPCPLTIYRHILPKHLRIFHFPSCEGAEAQLPCAAYPSAEGQCPEHSAAIPWAPGNSWAVPGCQSSICREFPPNQHWSQSPQHFTADLAV